MNSSIFRQSVSTRATMTHRRCSTQKQKNRHTHTHTHIHPLSLGVALLSISWCVHVVYERKLKRCGKKCDDYLWSEREEENPTVDSSYVYVFFVVFVMKTRRRLISASNHIIRSNLVSSLISSLSVNVIVRSTWVKSNIKLFDWPLLFYIEIKRTNKFERKIIHIYTRKPNTNKKTIRNWISMFYMWFMFVMVRFIDLSVHDWTIPWRQS
jgi:hypothetical protein